MPIRFLALALLLPLLTLAGCDFQPLYGNRATPGDAVTGDFAATQIDTIADRQGQLLRNELLDRLNYRGEPTKPNYELKIKLTEVEQQILVRSDEVATAINLTSIADYELIDITSKRVLTSGRSTSINRYNILRSPYATVVSKEDAQKRAGQQIAEDLRTRLGVYFNSAKNR
jgi:LPS-assembly lipoprotein